MGHVVRLFRTFLKPKGSPVVSPVFSSLDNVNKYHNYRYDNKNTVDLFKLLNVLSGVLYAQQLTKFVDVAEELQSRYASLDEADQNEMRQLINSMIASIELHLSLGALDKDKNPYHSFLAKQLLKLQLLAEQLSKLQESFPNILPPLSIPQQPPTWDH